MPRGFHYDLWTIIYCKVWRRPALPAMMKCAFQPFAVALEWRVHWLAVSSGTQLTTAGAPECCALCCETKLVHSQGRRHRRTEARGSVDILTSRLILSKYVLHCNILRHPTDRNYISDLGKMSMWCVSFMYYGYKISKFALNVMADGVFLSSAIHQ